MTGAECYKHLNQMPQNVKMTFWINGSTRREKRCLSQLLALFKLPCKIFCFYLSRGTCEFSRVLYAEKRNSGPSQQ